MKIEVEFGQTVSRTAVIEVDEDEFMMWSGGTGLHLDEFLRADRDQAKVQDELITAAWQQSTDARFEEFRIMGAKRA